MPEPIPDTRLQLFRRRFLNLEEYVYSLGDDEVVDARDMIREAFQVAKVVPKLIDEIERLKGELHARTAEHPADA